MKTLKKVLRILALLFLVILAASGAGMLGAFSPNNREKYMDKEIRIERVDKNRDEEEDIEEDKN